MKRSIRILSILMAALMLLSFTACDISDGMLWVDFEGDDSILGVHTEERPKDPSTDNEPEKDGDIDQGGTEDVCLHLNLNTIYDVEPTCTESGLAHGNCLDCGKSFSDKEIPALGHTEGMWIIEIKPTTVSEGRKYNECTVCGEKHYEVLDIINYSEGLAFVSLENNTCMVSSRGSCTDTKVSIPPESPNGETVIAIGDEAFRGDSVIVELVMPDTIELIGIEAFAGSSVQTVSFSDSLTDIFDGAFKDSELRDVAFPASLRSIGREAFKNTNLTRVQIPNGVTTIFDEAFSNCSNLMQLNISESVTSIGRHVVSSGYISNITVASGNECYFVENNCLVSNDGELLLGWGRCTIPNRVRVICAYAFENNLALTNVSLPSSLDEIEEGAFSGTRISEIVIHENIKYINQYAFLGCENLEKVVIKNGVFRIGKRAFDGCNTLSVIEFYGSVDEWNNIDIDPDNEGLYSVSIDFIEGVAPDTVYYYGVTTISGKALELYQVLVDAVMREEPETYITLSASDKYTIDDFYLARHMFLSDYPENFWWGGAARYSHTNDYIVSIEFQYNYAYDEIVIMRNELERVVEEILESLPDGDVYEKALYLHDEVARRVTYEFTENDQTPYGALVEGKAVCNGYATSYQLLLQRAGIRAWTINGTSRGENHAWNVVWLSENVCVYSDVTWDDQEAIMHYYFNMSLEEMSKDHNVNSYFDLPSCGHDDYGYDDIINDAFVLNDYDNAKVLAEFFGDVQNGERVAQFYYHGDDFSEWLSRNSSDLCYYLDCNRITYSNLGQEYVVVASGITGK